MTKARLSQLGDIDDVARAAGVDKSRIVDYALSNSQLDYYEKLQIPKRGAKRRGQFRTVYSSKQTWLSGLHRSVAMMISNSVSFDEHVQGFVKGRSIRTNAELHLGAKVLLHADIKGFFDGIHVDQVKYAFVALGTKMAVATTLAQACTINGYLRQGTRCSPTIANLVCRQMDTDLLSLAATSDSTYTRYADDLTFSGTQVPDVSSIEYVLKQHGFDVRPGSCFSQCRGKRQFVTGLNIADAEHPRLQKRLKRRLRLIAHKIAKYGGESHFENTTSSV